jgi:DNA-binding MarR family transcriptional regulator
MASAPNLGAQLRLLTAKLDGELQAVYDSMGLPFRPRFYPIVQHLLRDGSASVTALAQATEVTQPAATQTIAEMAKLGLVTIASGPNGRERSVRLTAHGQQLAEQLRSIWDAVGEAARALDRELPHPLSETIAAAIAALTRESFGERIRSKVHNG